MTNQEGRAANPSFPEDAKPWPDLQNSERLKVVEAYLNLGWSVIPVRADKASALSDWQCYQNDRPSLEDWRRWLEGEPSNGIRPIDDIVGLGVVCGEVSRNLFVLDFDRLEVWQKFAATHAEAVKRTRVVKTGRGWHVYHRTDDGPVASRKLDGIDVLGQGKLALLPPSLHPSRVMYHDLNPDWNLMRVKLGRLQEVLQPYGWESPRDTQAGERPAHFEPIVELLRPYWEKPNHHSLSVPLAGLLVKSRWPWELAEGLFNALVPATDDEEGRGRLADLRGTYERLERGDPVEGYAGLEEILRPDDLAHLTGAVAEVGRDAFDMEAELACIAKLDKVGQARAMWRLVDWAVTTNLPEQEVEVLGIGMKQVLKLPDSKFQRMLKAAREEARRGQVEKAAEGREEITEEHRAEARIVLTHLHLLRQLADACAFYGVAGERKNVCLLYLALTSRLLDEPISITIKGDPSAGKSYVLSHVLWLFPRDAYWELTGMSQQALIYTERNFAHRTIVIMERPGMGKADYHIRTLQSEGRIAFETVEKGPHGKQRNRTIEKEGPTNFISTTIEAVGDVQNETRHWTLMADESPEQTARVLKMQGKKLQGRVPSRSGAVALKVAQAMQYLLEPKRVVIPYGDWLSDRMPTEPLRIRRDFGRLGAAIQAMALLHQYQRDEDEEGMLVATVADYAMVRPLLADTFGSSLDNMTPKTLELVKVVREIYEEKRAHALWDSVHVTVYDIQKRTGRGQTSITERLGSAIEEGHLQNVGGGRRGQGWKLVPGYAKSIGESILPTVDDLAEAFPKLVRPWVDPLTGEKHPAESDQTG